MKSSGALYSVINTKFFSLIFLHQSQNLGWSKAPVLYDVVPSYGRSQKIISILLSSIFFIGKIELPISLKFQAYILMILMGPPFAGFLVLPNAIIADIIDYDEKLTGLRREGVYYGVQAFVIKVGVSLATFVAGLIMGYFGKNVGHDLGIRLLGPTAAFFIFIALIVFQFYPLEEKRETTAEPR